MKGTGGTKGIRIQSRGGSATVDFLPKIQLMIVVQGEKVDQVVDTIIASARTDGGTYRGWKDLHYSCGRSH